MRAFWTAEDLAVWIGLALPTLLVSGLIAKLLLSAQTPRALAAQFIFYLIWFVLLKVLLQLKYAEQFWWSLGWTVPESGLWICLLTGPFLAVGLNFLAQWMNAPPADPPFQDMLFDKRLRAVFGIASVLAGPLCEELAFRGFLLPLMAKWLGVAAGIVATGAVFACAHGPQNNWMWQYLVLLTVAGSMFGWARWRYASTMSSLVMHASFNLTVFSLTYMVETIEWTSDGVVMIDQTRLPHERVFVTCRDAESVAKAIEDMIIRGAPAIGVAGAMGVALGMQTAAEPGFDAICERLAKTRPTAVNLFWAIDRMKRVFASLAGQPLAAIRARLIAEAQLVKDEDIASCRAIGRNGAALIPDGATVLTHCNAGALATGGYGTALGVIRAAAEDGKKIRVFADETRPYLQGARLTAWELVEDGIDTTLITDNMAGHFMKLGRISCVVVGADRIAANGDVANKIGTYSVAVLAKENGIPFYVAAPISTLDLSLAHGGLIHIENRAASEVTEFRGHPVAPLGVKVENPAFDVTPAKYVTAIITERGVAREPYEESLAMLAR